MADKKEKTGVEVKAKKTIGTVIGAVRGLGGEIAGGVVGTVRELAKLPKARNGSKIRGVAGLNVDDSEKFGDY